jgi:hypothetical protein
VSAAAAAAGVPGNVGPRGAYGVGRGVRDVVFEEGESSGGEGAAPRAVGLPPKKKPRGGMVSAPACGAGGAAADGEDGRWAVAPAAQGLCGETVGYYWDVDGAWHCARVREYRLADDMHCVEHADGSGRRRWVNLRVLDVRFADALDARGTPAVWSCECV